MNLHKLQSYSYLIVDPEKTIVDLAYLLGLGVDVDLDHDHFYMAVDTDINFKEITSYMFPTNRDVRVTPEVFIKILIDIASGTPLKSAFENQGYTF